MSESTNPKEDQEQPETNLNQENPKPQTEEATTSDPAEDQQAESKEKSSKKDDIDRDKIIHVDSLDDAPVYDDNALNEMEQFYDQSLMEIRENEIVRGRVVSISGKDIAVDIGFKAEGTIDLEEFDDIELINIGDEINVFLDKVEDQEGQLVLSKRKADFMKTWEMMVHNFEDETVIKGRITRRIKGGMVVDLNNIDAFLPGSQIDIHPVRDFDALVGEEMDFRIVKINELRKNIVLSHKILIEESLAEVREKILLEMDVGSIMEGTVKNITDFGVFVDLGGVDGLLHITDLSWGRINHPSEVVSLDDKITVKIIDYDPVRKRVSVGYKQLLPHPWEGVEERYPIDAKVTGKVVSITNYGAFIELEKGVEGLIHVSEMSWTQHIKHPSALLSIGDEVEAVVLSMDVNERKISLGMKQIEPDPWESLETKYTVGSRHNGTVRDLVPFGAFVELEDGIEGLVHISDLSWTKKVRHPGEIVKKGEEINVIILGFDRNERRIALGHKQISDSPWNTFETEYAVGTGTQGRVVRLIDKGVIVELPSSVEGFVPNSQLGRDEEGSLRKRLNPGDTLDLIVVEFEKEAKRIVLSATEARKRKEADELKDFKDSKGDKEEAPSAEAEAKDKKDDEKTAKDEEPASDEQAKSSKAPKKTKAKEVEAEPESTVKAEKGTKTKEETADAETADAETADAETAVKAKEGTKPKADKDDKKPPAKATSKKTKIKSEQPESSASEAKAEDDQKEEKPKKQPAKKKTTKKAETEKADTKSTKKVKAKAETAKSKKSESSKPPEEKSKDKTDESKEETEEKSE